ncbi:MAG: YerC/YecD family TrpR-related protein [Candidatus Komeilibacteria bacterium]|nr:YerC/YecD family TrpR-related protein [Candidatus Komeilibacteria bacterium]
MHHSHPYSQKKAEELWQAVLRLKTKEECRRFFRDLCTIQEMTAMADRWQAVKKINDNEPYRDIAKQVGMSSTTVARVAYWLNHGQGGYRLMLKKLKLL